MSLPVYTKKELKDLDMAKAKAAEEAVKAKEIADLKIRIEKLEALQPKPNA